VEQRELLVGRQVGIALDQGDERLAQYLLHAVAPGVRPETAQADDRVGDQAVGRPAGGDISGLRPTAGPSLCPG
jgi:hypothetical protein